MTRTIALLGNAGPGTPEYSTENEYAHAYEALGYQVLTYNESDPSEFRRLIDTMRARVPVDWIHWTSTKAFRDLVGPALQWEMLASTANAGVPVVGVHLDKFWEIPAREQWLRDDPYFRGCDIMLTADGGNHPWEEMGINHAWLPPGVSSRWCHEGTPRVKYMSDVAFVGSWQGSYHRESIHRRRLILHLRNHWSKYIKFWPEYNQAAIRGDELTDLYWSTKVVVGDSYFVGAAPPPFYGSDRSPETLGRGGILLHTKIEGWNVDHPDGTPAPFSNSYTYDAFDWNDLDAKITTLLELDDETRTAWRKAGIEETLASNTYERRVDEIEMILGREGLL